MKRIIDFFKNKVKSIYDVCIDRNNDIETRISVMFISIGVISAILGAILCILCCSTWISTFVCLFIALFCGIVIHSTIKKGNTSLTKKLIVYLVIIAIPIIFIFAGGLESGCIIWLIYELFFITLACYGKKLLRICLFVGGIDIILIHLDYFGYFDTWHLVNEKVIFISTLGSFIIVTFSILITLKFLKNIYKKEQAFLYEKQKELEIANQHERNFLANMSHEFRTPINAILNFNEMILRESNEDTILDYSDNIKNASDSLLSLVNDILDYSQIEQGKMVLNEDTYSLKELLESCIKVMYSNFEKKGLRFIVKVSPKLPALLYGDQKRIKQIILNLLTNAYKYTDKGEVILVVDQDNRLGDILNLRIDVIDTGHGIALENTNDIFENFKRDRKEHNIEGSGLGLSLCKNLCTLMNGEIKVESKLGAGSTFSVIISQRIMSKALIEPINLHKKNTPSQSKGKVLTNEKRSILAVDDTAINLAILENLLKLSGLDIDTSNSGEKAIKMVQDKHYDLILMDIMMPNMDGIETLNHIREFNKDIPIIALTADAINGAREQYMQKGFTDYLTKPVIPGDLEKVIQKYV